MLPKSKRADAPRRTKKGSRYGPRQPSKPTALPPPPPSPAPTRPHLTSHIRPPHLSFGNPSIQSLLLDDSAIARYHGFKDRPFVQIHSLTSSFLDSLHIRKLHDMLSVQPMTSFILDNNDCIFPGMTAQFFANLCFENTHARTVNERTVIVSSVNRVTIRLDWHLLNTIFCTPLADPASTLHYWDESHVWPATSDKFKISELRTMFKVSSREAKDFNPSNLDPDDRVIYHIFINFINPVAGHFTSPGKVPLVYYFLFTHHTPIDWGFVVFNRLCDLITDHRRNLPHAQFLTPIFKHFQIPFTEAGIAPHPFDMGTLTKKGIRLHQGQWIMRQAYLAMTKSSTSSSPLSSPPATSPTESASLMASIQSLQHSVDALLHHVQYIEYGLTMVMPPDIKEEFQSDKILFAISSDDDSAAPADDSSLSFSDDDFAASATSLTSDLPLARHVKRSRMIP